jgi:hypothetical protein
MQNKLKIYLEIIWWIITLIVVYLVMKPIFDNLTMDYSFLWWNVIYIIFFITYTRYAFSLKHTFLANWTNAKIFLFFFSLPYLFFGIESVTNFKSYWDNEGLVEISTLLKYPLSELEKGNLYDYIKTETMLFGIGALMAGFLMALRMALSLWRERNTSKV